jgi:hypothetical protein
MPQPPASSPPPTDPRPASTPQPDPHGPVQPSASPRSTLNASRRGTTDLRRHRERTDRNLLVGFFALLCLVGGGLIWLLYGAGAAAFGLGCIAVGAVLTGLVLLLMLGLQWLSDYLERRALGD